MVAERHGQEWTYRGELIAAVDGDTCDVRVDLGFRVYAHLRFRLLGIDTPEKIGPTRTMGRAAQAYLQALLSMASPLLIESLGEPDKYGGRWDARIRISGGELDVGEHLIARGYAQSYDGTGPRPKWDTGVPYPLRAAP